MDAQDVDEIETALRETEEEIGYDRKKIQILGTMSDFLSITNLAVTPVVGYLDDFTNLNQLRLSQAEIAVPFILEVEKLINPSKIEFETRQRFNTNIVMPRFKAHPNYVIWGLTASILMQFFWQQQL